MKTRNENVDEKVERLREFVLRIDKAVLSEYDIFQKVFFDVELTRGDKIAQIVSDRERSRFELMPEDLYWNALEALASVIPSDLLEAYISVLESEPVKRMMALYPEVLKEFDKLCIETEKAKRFEGQWN